MLGAPKMINHLSSMSRLHMISLLLILLLPASSTFAQTTEVEGESQEEKYAQIPIDSLVDEQPKPLNLQEVVNKIGYPNNAKELGIQGMLIVRVLVDKEGKYRKHDLLRSPHPILTEAVAKHIADLAFTPAKLKGRSVNCYVNIPCRFKLTETKNPSRRKRRTRN